MYFWNTKALVGTLREDTLPQTEAMKYLVGHSLNYLMLYGPMKYVFYYTLTWEAVLFDILFFGMSIGQTLLGYSINSRYDNKDFMARFGSLAFILNLKFTILFWLGHFFMYMLIVMFPHNDSLINKGSTAFWYVFPIILQLLAFWRTKVHFQNMQSTKPN